MGPDRHVGMRLSACSRRYTENSRRRVWYVASESYGQYEATCPTRRLHGIIPGVAHQARPQNRAMPERTSLCVLQFRSFFRLVKQLGPQNEKLVTESRRFVL